MLVPCNDSAETPAKAGFSVPKKKIRQSVDRHRIRRLMVEAWRLNKHTVYEAVPVGMQLHLFIMFTDKVEPNYDKVCESLLKANARLITALAATHMPPPLPQPEEPDAQ